MTEREYPIRVTLKRGAGYADPWITIAGDTVPEVRSLLGQAEELTADVSHIAAVFHATSVGTPDAQQTPAVSAQQASPPQAQQTPPPTSRTCKHGQMTHRTGNGPKGPWGGWFCADKDAPDRCSPQWDK